jgi:hypothetical protein
MQVSRFNKLPQLLLLLLLCPQRTVLVCLQATPTAKGMKVVETGRDAMSRQLVQMHAAVVSKFVKNGMAEMHESHPAPKGAK